MSDKNEMSLKDFEKLLSEKLGAVVEAKIKDLGLDKVDTKHVMFYTKNDPNGKKLEDLTKEERYIEFVKAHVGNDLVTAKALSGGVAADGGLLIPEEWRTEITRRVHDDAVIRSRATVFPMATNKMNIPREGSRPIMSWGSENVSIGTTTVDFEETELTPFRMNARLHTSRELLNDAPQNLVSYLTEIFANAVRVEEDKVFMTGSGSGRPTGINQASIPSLAFNSPPTGDKIIQLYYKLPQGYRKTAFWIMNSRVIAVVRQLKDNQGMYILQPDFSISPTGTILGRPVLEQNDLGTTEIYFGDIKGYIIGDREQMSLETTTEGAGTFEKHQLAMKVIERIDAKVHLTEAFTKATGVQVS